MPYDPSVTGGRLRAAAYCEQTIFAGLILAIWFASWAQGAHDLWAADALFALLTVLAVLYFVGQLLNRTRLRLPLLWPSIILVSALWLSYRQSFDKNGTLLECWGWTFSVVAFFLGAQVLQSPARCAAFFRWSGLTLVPLACYCLWQQFTSRPDSWGHWEIHGSLVNSAALAGFVLNWVFILWADRRRYDWMLWTELMAAAVLLILARSSWAGIALLFGLVYFYWDVLCDWASQRRQVLWVVAGSGFIIFSSVVGWKLRMHVGPYVGISRFYYWRSALAMWRHSPWTGVGLGAYAAAYPFFKMGHVQGTLFAHSFFFQWLAECGLVGVAAITFWAWRFRSAIAHTPKAESRAYGATLLTVIIFSAISISQDFLVNHLLLALLAAAALSGAETRIYSCRASVSMIGIATLFTVVPGWLVLLVGSRLYQSALYEEQHGSLLLARQFYQDATSINPSLSEAYFRLALLDVNEWKANRLPEILQRARSEINHALDDKKDAAYLAVRNELQRP